MNNDNGIPHYLARQPGQAPLLDALEAAKQDGGATHIPQSTIDQRQSPEFYRGLAWRDLRDRAMAGDPGAADYIRAMPKPGGGQ